MRINWEHVHAWHELYNVYHNINDLFSTWSNITNSINTHSGQSNYNKPKHQQHITEYHFKTVRFHMHRIVLLKQNNNNSIGIHWSSIHALWPYLFELECMERWLNVLRLFSMHIKRLVYFWFFVWILSFGNSLNICSEFIYQSNQISLVNNQEKMMSFHFICGTQLVLYSKF